MTKIRVDQIDELIAEVDRYGGDFVHPEFVKRYAPLELEFETPVNQDLSPYSAEYFDQQIELYEEISGRKLNQQDGELHPGDMAPLLTAPNPLGVLDVASMSEHVRSVSIMLSLAVLSGRAEVLDMGAGHGIASEIMAFCGCNVHAVDIDPVLGNMSRQRAAARGMNIIRSVMNFDDLSSIADQHYAAAFFSQSLHHCLRPWELIASLKNKLTAEGGIIGFVGEPIQDIWWRNWGLRLDEISLYVARKEGWFESGWSFEFLGDCFARNGFVLTLFKGGFVGGEIGIATLSSTKLDEVMQKANSLGLSVSRSYPTAVSEENEISVDDGRFMTLIGRKASLCGRAAYRQVNDEGGILVYGPYVDLEPGTYEFSMILHCPGRDDVAPAGKMSIDVAYDVGEGQLFKQDFLCEEAFNPMLVVRQFEVKTAARKVEVRAGAFGSPRWTVSLPSLRRVEGADLMPKRA